MSARTCDHLITSDHKCSALVHTTVKVGVPGTGAVWVYLCFSHRNASDGYLTILARAKIARQREARDILPREVKRGLLVALRDSGSLAEVTHTEEDHVRLRFTSGLVLGSSREEFLKLYIHPQLTTA